MLFELHAAAKQANIDEIKKLISEGADVNQCDSDNRVPLHYLITGFLVFNSTDDVQQIFEIMDIFLEAGADINAKDKKYQNRTILHWAADSQNPILVKGLLQRKANVHCGNFFNATPLYLAVQRRGFNDQAQNETVKLLLDYGANINTVSTFGFTPISLVETSNNPTLFNLLSEYGVPSIEKTKQEKEMAALLNQFSSFFVKEEHKKQYEPKSLKELAANAGIKIRYKENLPTNYYKHLLLLPNNVRENFPQLEFDPKKLFIYKVNKCIERKFPELNETDNSKEIAYLKKIKEALSSETPYNTIHGIMGKLGSDIKKGFLSIFKDHMEPVRKQIVLAMEEFKKDKPLYEQQTKGMKLG